MAFSQYLNSKREDMKALVRELRRYYAYVSVLGTDCRSYDYRVDKNTALVSEGAGECGFVVKVSNGGAFGEFSTDNIDGDKAQLARTIAARIALDAVANPIACPLPADQPCVASPIVNIHDGAAATLSVASYFFDQDGVSLQDKTIIKDGVVVGYWGNYRFGQYLGEPVAKITGNLPCMRLNAGTFTVGEGDYLECVAMSNVQVDIYSNYIGGEVRLAYLHRNGTVVPVTGISISGQLSDVLSGVLLGREVVTQGHYQGPSFIKLPAMQIM